jgi:hypothetical protein
MSKNYVAGAAITAYSIVKFGSSDGVVLLGAAETDRVIGVTGILLGESGGRVDVEHFGYAEVKLAGTVARGEKITANSAGLGVKLTDVMLAAGHAYSVGFALQSGVSGDIIRIFVLPEAVSKVDEFTASTAEINSLDGAPLGATFVVGAEAANAKNVAIQLTDAGGADIAVRGGVFAYLSDDANGDAIVATAPDGGVVIGTDGLAIPLVANKAFMLTSEADGDIDLTITHAAGVKTCYLIIRLPNGKHVASGAITFA